MLFILHFWICFHRHRNPNELAGILLLCVQHCIHMSSAQISNINGKLLALWGYEGGDYWNMSMVGGRLIVEWYLLNMRYLLIEKTCSFVAVVVDVWTQNREKEIILNKTSVCLYKLSVCDFIVWNFSDIYIYIYIYIYLRCNSRKLHESKRQIMFATGRVQIISRKTASFRKIS